MKKLDLFEWLALGFVASLICALGWLLHHENWVEHQKCLAEAARPNLCP